MSFSSDPVRKSSFLLLQIFFSYFNAVKVYQKKVYFTSDTELLRPRVDWEAKAKMRRVCSISDCEPHKTKRTLYFSVNHKL